MKTNNSLTLTVILVFLMQLVIGQTKIEKELQGKITLDYVLAEGVNVINISNQKATVSDKYGLFQLVVKEGDVLVFSAVNLEILRKKINKQDLTLDLIPIQMFLKSDELKEVIVNKHPEINAVSLGISPKGMKHYTAAERKIYTANSGGIDGLLNKISGRTAMLKKELVVEKKEGLLLKIDLLFEYKYYVETLKISGDYIKGFQYYCIEDSSFAVALQSKNKTMTMFLIVPLAEKFNKIIRNEN